MAYLKQINPGRKKKLEMELERYIPILIRLGIEKMILFGSMAEGNVRSFSDLDILVVMETSDAFIQRLEKVYSAIRPLVSCDILVYSPSEIEQMKRESSFFRRILSTGKVIYEAKK